MIKVPMDVLIHGAIIYDIIVFLIIVIGIIKKESKAYIWFMSTVLMIVLFIEIVFAISYLL